MGGDWKPIALPPQAVGLVEDQIAGGTGETEDVLRIRLDLIGADCSCIFACDTFEHPLDLSQPAGARLVVIDPIQAFPPLRPDPRMPLRPAPTLHTHARRSGGPHLEDARRAGDLLGSSPKEHAARFATIDGRCGFRWASGWGLAAIMVTITLYRPVGPDELSLMQASGWRHFPPRLPGQPIFYRVLQEEYAVLIARDWNVCECGAGFVTRFAVVAEYLEQFEVHEVRGRECSEYWIPVELLADFNDEIAGLIELVADFPAGSTLVPAARRRHPAVAAQPAGALRALTLPLDPSVGGFGLSIEISFPGGRVSRLGKRVSRL